MDSIQTVQVKSAGRACSLRSQEAVKYVKLKLKKYVRNEGKNLCIICTQVVIKYWARMRSARKSKNLSQGEQHVRNHLRCFFQIKHNLPSSSQFQKCNFATAYWSPQCASLETCMRTTGLGMIHDDHAKNSGKESSFKSWPTNRDLGRRLRQITARRKRINTSKI